MFEWLEKMLGLHDEEYKKVVAEKSPRPDYRPPLPPMSEVKQPDISEPVVKLLAALERDEWELYNCTILDWKEYNLINVFTEEVLFKLKLSDFATSLKLNVYSKEFPVRWMTTDEIEAVNKALQGVKLRCDNWHKDYQRNQCAYKIRNIK